MKTIMTVTAKNICYSYALEDSKIISLLLKIKTSSDNKAYSKSLIRAQINNDFIDQCKTLQDKLLDIGLHLSVNKRRYKRQDLDNIQKVVFDAIQKDKKKPQRDYLIKNDSQIVRCLVYKTERIENINFDTDQLTISLREHDPKKQMIMKGMPPVICTIITPEGQTL